MIYLTKFKKTEFYKLLKRMFIRENVVTCQLLGLCSALAVSNTLQNAFTMGVGVTLVTIATSFFISSMRKIIPYEFRIITYMIIISTFVIFFDLFLKCYFPNISRTLGPYVGLIITNCIIMGRQEAFSSKNSILLSITDALGNGLAYTKALMIIAFFRELLAFGSIFGINVVPNGYENVIVLSMAPGAFFILSLYIWIFKSINKIPNDKI